MEECSRIVDMNMNGGVWIFYGMEWRIRMVI